MEISGSFHSSSAYPLTSSSRRNPQQRPDPEPAPSAQNTLQQTIKPQQGGYETRQKQAFRQEKELPHSAQQAINSYIDSDFAGGPELMNRVDVYA